MISTDVWACTMSPQNLVHDFSWLNEKENWLNLCADLLKHAKVDENFVKYIAMGDGMWMKTL
jgi:hypothetical protein